MILAEPHKNHAEFDFIHLECVAMEFMCMSPFCDELHVGTLLTQKLQNCIAESMSRRNNFYSLSPQKCSSVSCITLASLCLLVCTCLSDPLCKFTINQHNSSQNHILHAKLINLHIQYSSHNMPLQFRALGRCNPG